MAGTPTLRGVREQSLKLISILTQLELGVFSRHCQKISRQMQQSAKAGSSSNLGCQNIYLSLS